jgi:hypothetical protein
VNRRAVFAISRGGWKELAAYCGVIIPVVVHSQLSLDTFHIPPTRSLSILAGVDMMVLCGIEECRCPGVVQLCSHSFDNIMGEFERY